MGRLTNRLNADKQNGGQSTGGGRLSRRLAAERNQPEESTGFLQTLVRNIAKPFIKTAATGASAIKGVAGAGKAGIESLQGNQKQAKIDLIKASDPVNIDAGYFGKAEPIGAKGESDTQLIKEAVGTGAEMAGTLLPAGKAASLGGKIVQAGASSALTGGGQALGEGKNTMEAAKEAFKQGLTGAATVGVLSGSGKLIGDAAKKLPERLYNSALQVSKKMLVQEKSPAQFMIDKGNFGTLGGIIKTAGDKITELDGQIDKKLNDSLAVLDTTALRGKILTGLKAKFGKAYNEKTLGEIIDGLPISSILENKTISVADANQLRQQLDRHLGETYFMSDKQAPVIKEAIGTTANILRTNIKNVTGTSKEFWELAQYIKARDLAIEALAGADKNWGIGFKDLLFGGALSGGNALNMAMIIGAKKALTSPSFKTFVAVNVDRANKAISKLPTDKVGRVSRVAVLNVLKNAFSSQEE